MFTRVQSPRAIARAVLLAACAAALMAFVSPASGAREQTDLIVGGAPTTDVPYQALVYIEGKTAGQARGGRCTGAVIGARWVMTAAHCLTQNQGPDTGAFLAELSTLVVTGRSDTSLIAELERTGDPAVADQVAQELDPALGEDYFISEAWNPASSLFLADVALIRLDRAIAPELGIAPARGDQVAAFAPGTAAEVSGWGVTEAGTVSSLLRTAPAPVRPGADCAELALFGFVDNAMLCSGENGPPPQGTCKGDSGGALVAPSDYGVPIAGGITSFGPPDCTRQPAAFTRVSAFTELIVRVLTQDDTAPVQAPEIDSLALTPDASGVIALDARIDANGSATNLEFTFAPLRPAAPLRRGVRVGSGDDSRDITTGISGLAPGVSYEWSVHASGVLGRVAGPTGTITMPGDVVPVDATPETTRCRPSDTPPAAGGSGSISISRRQLAINQRIGQAALKRLNAIEDWINAGIVATDLCGGGIGAGDLEAIDLALAGAGPEPRLPAPRPLSIERLSPIDLGRFSVSPGQLRTNQRIYQAALRRARGLRARLAGSLTGGDIRDGQLDWDALPPGAMMTRLERGNGSPPSTTNISVRSSRPRGGIRVSASQLRINQKIAQAAVREANALRAQIGAGLTGENFAPASISARDFTPEISGRATPPPQG